ncbi:MAG: ZIP family metal transporter [Patescibacteria group bacterium]
MTETWLYTLGSVVVISLISLIGVFSFSVSQEKLKKALLFLVSLSAGGLLGGAFIHLLPEAFEACGTELQLSLYILLGIVIFFILEKVLYWRHCHIPTSDDHPHPFAYTNLIGDGLHNLIDGMIIAGSFLVSIPVGIATSVAVILHEVPQEIGDFGVLLHAGFSRKKALLTNFLTALLAIVGAIVILSLNEQLDNILSFVVPLTIGGFIYIATADLIPELKKETKIGRSILQLLIFLVGIGLMLLLLLLE